jgi:hypothetical protein
MTNLWAGSLIKALPSKTTSLPREAFTYAYAALAHFESPHFAEVSWLSQALICLNASTANCLKRVKAANKKWNPAAMIPCTEL